MKLVKTSLPQGACLVLSQGSELIGIVPVRAGLNTEEVIQEACRIVCLTPDELLRSTYKIDYLTS